MRSAARRPKKIIDVEKYWQPILAVFCTYLDPVFRGKKMLVKWCPPKVDRSDTDNSASFSKLGIWNTDEERFDAEEAEDGSGWWFAMAYLPGGTRCKYHWEVAGKSSLGDKIRESYIVMGPHVHVTNWGSRRHAVLRLPTDRTSAMPVICPKNFLVKILRPLGADDIPENVIILDSIPKGAIAPDGRIPAVSWMKIDILDYESRKPKRGARRRSLERGQQKRETRRRSQPAVNSQHISECDVANSGAQTKVKKKKKRENTKKHAQCNVTAEGRQNEKKSKALVSVTSSQDGALRVQNSCENLTDIERAWLRIKEGVTIDKLELDISETQIDTQTEDAGHSITCEDSGPDVTRGAQLSERIRRSLVRCRDVIRNFFRFGCATKHAVQV
jgi:hypothetical protein